MKLFTALLLCSLIGFVLCEPLPVLSRELLCQKCNQISSLASGNLVHVEKIVKTILVNLSESICRNIPKSELIESICTVLKKNFIDGVVTIIQGLERQLSPDVVCRKVCA